MALAKKLFLFGVMSLITVVVGLAIYNRLAPRAPVLSTITGGRGTG